MDWAIRRILTRSQDLAHGYRSQIELSGPQCPQCGKKFATISNARVHIKRQSCSRSKSCNTRSIFHSTRPQQPRPKSVCAPVVSSTATIVYGAISHGRPAEIRQEAEESSRVSLGFHFRARRANDQPGTTTQGSRDSHELPRHCIEESRSLVKNSVSHGPRHRTSTDTDQGPINVQRDTDREWTSPDGTTTSHSGQNIGAMATLPAPFGRPLCQVSRHADQPRGSGTSQREPSRSAEDQKGRQNVTPHSPIHFSCASMERGIPDAHPTTERRSPFTMQLLPAQKPVTLPVEPAVIPTSRDGVADRETPRNSESPTFSQVLFFLPLRDSGSTETAVRMSLRCPQVCATERLERPLQCAVMMILCLAARRIMLVPHEWTPCYSRVIVVVVVVVQLN